MKYVIRQIGVASPNDRIQADVDLATVPDSATTEEIDAIFAAARSQRDPDGKRSWGNPFLAKSG